MSSLRFSDDIELMTGSRPGIYWLICWKFVSPLAMILILVASVINMIMEGAGYEAWDAVNGEKYEREWPIWCKILIGVLICLSVLWIPAVALLQ
jgi:solute carrier family 6 amino acid/orphan transporter-like 15/16/17/18/20